MPIHQPNRPSGFAVSLWMAAALSVYAVMLLITLASLLEMSGDIPVFDMMPVGYDAEYALRLLTTLGSDGRDYYLWRQIPLDLVYPALFGVSFFLLATWLAGTLPAFQRILRWSAFVALAAGAFDYIENILIILLLRNYPDLSDVLVQSASIATLSKSGLTMIYFTVLIVVLVVKIVQFTFKSRSPKTS
ncbi:hypothetical protein A9Q96_01235 [Rhodobacterales bacterium 52_120_T64]|nr:hypothetical protein A9Q96_01235 [Rhodobacterales bacterium 52_120_T64]